MCKFSDKFNNRLTIDQKKIAFLIYKGMRNCEISKKTGKHKGTIGKHLFNILKKLECNKIGMIKLMGDNKEELK